MLWPTDGDDRLLVLLRELKLELLLELVENGDAGCTSTNPDLAT